MKTITLYELLGLVKDDKAPKKIKISELIYNFNDEKQMYFAEDGYELSDNIYLTKNLNHPVEILEEEKKIPEKLETFKDRNNEIFLDDLCYKYMPIHKDSLSFNEQVIVDKLNEVLDYLKSKKDE